MDVVKKTGVEIIVKILIAVVSSIVVTFLTKKMNLKKDELSCRREKSSLNIYLKYLMFIVSIPLLINILWLLIYGIFEIKVTLDVAVDIGMYLSYATYCFSLCFVGIRLKHNKIKKLKYRRKVTPKIMNIVFWVTPIIILIIVMIFLLNNNYNMTLPINVIFYSSIVVFEVLAFIFLNTDSYVYKYVRFFLNTNEEIEIEVEKITFNNEWICINEKGGEVKIRKNDVLKVKYYNTRQYDFY